MMSLCVGLRAQRVITPEVLTVVYATSDDGFVNIRTAPSAKSAVKTKLYGMFHGLGGGVLRGHGDKWSQVSVGKVTGWAATRFLGYQDWYTHEGDTVLVAGRNEMPIYTDNYVDEGELNLFTTVRKGIILGDTFDIIEGYYVLKTGHDYLFLRKEDVELRIREK